MTTFYTSNNQSNINININNQLMQSYIQQPKPSLKLDTKTLPFAHSIISKKAHSDLSKTRAKNVSSQGKSRVGMPVVAKMNAKVMVKDHQDIKPDVGGKGLSVADLCDLNKKFNEGLKLNNKDEDSLQSIISTIYSTIPHYQKIISSGDIILTPAPALIITDAEGNLLSESESEDLEIKNIKDKDYKDKDMEEKEKSKNWEKTFLDVAEAKERLFLARRLVREMDKRLNGIEIM